MLEHPNFARRFLWIRLLAASLVLGALYDLGFAAIFIAAPEWAARVFRLPLPGAEFYLWLIAIFLTMLAALYLTAAKDLRRYTGIVLVASVGRIAGGVAFALAASRDPSLAGLWPLAFADFGFGLVHGGLWMASRT